jgi:hypothetical protein
MTDRPRQNSRQAAIIDAMKPLQDAHAATSQRPVPARIGHDRTFSERAEIQRLTDSGSTQVSEVDRLARIAREESDN